ncbi:MAG: hypothetical protein RL264_2486 [Bacteroidota bacterium]|jgi:predicted protein tyrosine phosphatase
MKNLNLLFLVFLFVACNSKNDKTEHFEKRYKELISVSPEDLCMSFLEKCDTKDEKSPFSSYTPEMINSQLATFYRIESEDHLKLVTDILYYKKVITSKEKSIEDLIDFVGKIKSGKKDKLDKIVIKSFELAVNYKTEEIKIDGQ